MKVEKIDFDLDSIPKNCPVTKIQSGNTVEISYSSCTNHTPTIRKISKEKYFVTKSGEIRDFKKKSTIRVQSPESLKRSFKKIKRLVLANVTEPNKVRWVTLTYRENMTDTDRLYQDFRRYTQRFNSYCKKHGYGKPEYIAIVEPQERGAFHWHIFYIWRKKAPYIENEKIAKVWSHGFVSIKSISDADNIAGYLSAYLCNAEIDASLKDYFPKDSIAVVKDGKQSKYFLKGGRLFMYPKNLKLVRHSKGIKYPVKETVSKRQADKEIAQMTKTYESSFLITKDDGFCFVTATAEYRC